MVPDKDNTYEPSILESDSGMSSDSGLSRSNVAVEYDRKLSEAERQAEDNELMMTTRESL